MNYKALSKVDTLPTIHGSTKMLVVDNGEVYKTAIQGSEQFDQFVKSVNGKTGQNIYLDARDINAQFSSGQLDARTIDEALELIRLELDNLRNLAIPFVVTFSGTQSSCTANKTFAEIKSAYNQNLRVEAISPMHNKMHLVFCSNTLIRFYVEFDTSTDQSATVYETIEIDNSESISYILHED